MSLTFKNIAINVAYYAVTVVLLPMLVLQLEDSVGVSRISRPALRVIAAIVGVAGIAVQMWCIVLFQRVGRGTPSPLVPTRRLVHSGPYRRVRNPMNIGEMLVFLALALWFGSIGLMLYALAAWLAFHIFIVRTEEPRHRAQFGDEYASYTARVNRWLPTRDQRPR